MGVDLITDVPGEVGVELLHVEHGEGLEVSRQDIEADDKRFFRL